MQALIRWTEDLPGVADDATLAIRVRVQHAIWLLSVGLGTLYVVGFLVLGVYGGAISVTLLILLATLALFGFTRRGNPTWGGRVMSWVFFLNFLGAIAGRGGVEGSAIPWLLLPPVVGALMLDMREAIRLTLATIVAVVGFWLFENVYGHELVSDVPEHLRKYAPLVDYPAISLMLLAAFWGIRNVFKATNRRLDQQNQALQREVAQRKEAEAQARLAAQARYTFLATMSHEIRTPLNGVLGLTQVLERTPLSADQQQLVGTIQVSGGLLRRLLDDVLDYAKVDSGHMELDPEAVDLRVLCTQLLSLWRGSAQERGIDLRLELDWEGPLWVRLDANKLRQILGNLVSNALKFTPPQGRVTLRIQTTLTQLHLSVSDTGSGISEQDQQTIFEAFKQADGSDTRAHGGTGLGLAISQRLSQLMGGQIHLESTLGEGSSFHVTLPREDAPASPEAPEPKQEEEVAGLRVLVAEDNVVNQLVIQRLLLELGVEVTLAQNGQEALERWQAEQPDVIFMDCQMPVCDGFQATRRIRAAGGTLPIVALTANAMPDDRARCIDAGMDEHLGKPVEREALHAVLLSLSPKGPDYQPGRQKKLALARDS